MLTYLHIVSDFHFSLLLLFLYVDIDLQSIRKQRIAWNANGVKIATEIECTRIEYSLNRVCSALCLLRLFLFKEDFFLCAICCVLESDDKCASAMRADVVGGGRKIAAKFDNDARDIGHLYEYSSNRACTSCAF